jgi:3-keto-L-gulonate-6-phosphate decarboxylase
MARYGNILTILNADESKHFQVIGVLEGKGTKYTKLKDTYYIETISKDNTKNVIKELKALNIDFIFFHNHISDGSYIEHNGINDEVIKDIKKILFE